MNFIKVQQSSKALLTPTSHVREEPIDLNSSRDPMRLLGISQRRTSRMDSGELELTAPIQRLQKRGQLELQSVLSEGRILVVRVSSQGEQLLRDEFGDAVWIEEENHHFPQVTYISAYRTYCVKVENEAGQPVPSNVVVMGFSDGKLTEDQETCLGSTTTDPNGSFFLEAKEHFAVSRALVTPYDGHWSIRTDGLPETVICPSIEYPGGGIAWWHRLLGFSKIDPNQGHGVRIGVIDSGCGAHAALTKVNRLAPHNNSESVSILPHGTLVCGILCARPSDNRGCWGVAPGADVYVTDVTDGEVYAPQWNIASSVRDLAFETNVDLINISMGSSTYSNILDDAIADAEDSGCLCICAAGNTGEDVMWPARSERVVAVSAVGIPNEIPKGTYASEFIPSKFRDEGFPVIATFSCHGPAIDCCGPGLGLITTYPFELTGHNDSWVTCMGTSVAAPAVCGTLAVMLARSVDYRETDRTAEKTNYARKTLGQLCTKIGLFQEHQGLGLVSV